MHRKTKDAIIERLKPGIIYAVAHGKSTEWTDGYNTMLKKAIEVIEKY